MFATGVIRPDFLAGGFSHDFAQWIGCGLSLTPPHRVNILGWTLISDTRVARS